MSNIELSQLSHTRGEIDKVDAALTELLATRAKLTQQAAHMKKNAGLAVYCPEREKTVLSAWHQALDDIFSRESVNRIAMDIIGACRCLEEPLRVAYLGPQGTFTEMAVIKAFGHEVRAIPCETFDAVIHQTEAGEADYGIVAAENSTEGTVTRVMDLLFKTKLKIVSEVSVPVIHNLLTKSGHLDGITKVCAHPQALAQCGGWLNRELPGVERLAVRSNAEGAKMAGENAQIAAIAAIRAVELYDVKPVARGIQDEAQNRTRFLIVGGEHAKLCSADVPDKTSAVFSVANQAGALYRILEPLKKHHVSMLRLESRPARNGAWDYNFFIDMEGHENAPNVEAALAEIRPMCSFFKVLGSYPAAQE